MQTTTAWYASKTLWLNVITLILALLDMAQIQALIPAGTLTIIVAVLNLILRLWFTSTPVSPTGKAAAVPKK